MAGQKVLAGHFLWGKCTTIWSGPFEQMRTQFMSLQIRDDTVCHPTVCGRDATSQGHKHPCLSNRRFLTHAPVGRLDPYRDDGRGHGNESHQHQNTHGWCLGCYGPHTDANRAPVRHVSGPCHFTHESDFQRKPTQPRMSEGLFIEEGDASSHTTKPQFFADQY